MENDRRIRRVRNRPDNRQGFVLDTVLDVVVAYLLVSKVTGKFQVTLPKRLAVAYGIKVGDELEFAAAGDHIVLRPPGRKPVDRARRLREFDRATERQRSRERARPLEPASERGWSREELYTRGRSD